MDKLNKIIISVLAAAEVLTLFPLLLFGLYFLINTQDIKAIDTTLLFGSIAAGMIYVVMDLFCAYKAIQNISRPKLAYLFISFPVIFIALVFLLKYQGLF